MNQGQLEELLTDLRGRYPDWDCKAAEIKAWTAMFDTHDYHTVKTALDTMWRGGYRKPNQGAFTKAATGVSTSSGRELYAGNRLTGTWLLCVEAPLHHPGRLGWAVPVVCGKAVPGRQELERIASKMAESHQRVYQGRWVIFYGMTYAQIDQRGRELRAQGSPGQQPAAQAQSKSMPSPSPSPPLPPCAGLPPVTAGPTGQTCDRTPRTVP